jgi:hypothetical protein
MRVGLLDEALAVAAMEDARTLTADYGSLRIPVGVPLEYVAGYDFDRCRQLVPDASTIYYLNLPPALGQEGVEELARDLDDRLRPGDAIVVEYPEPDSKMWQFYEDTMMCLRRTCKESQAFLDTNGSQASISLHIADVRVPAHRRPPPSRSGRRTGPLLATDAFRAEPRPRDGVATMTGALVSDELLAELWALYRHRFQWLGENHPISMEDSEAEFRKILLDESTLTSALFEAGRVVCFTYFLTKTSSCYWLNDSVLMDLLALTQGPETFTLFFGGIVSTQPGTGGMRPVLERLVHQVAQNGVDFQIAFQATNRSEKYIPHLIQKYVNDTGVLVCSQPRTIDRQIYRLFVVDD